MSYTCSIIRCHRSTRKRNGQVPWTFLLTGSGWSPRSRTGIVLPGWLHPAGRVDRRHLGPGLRITWQGGWVRRTPVAGHLGPAVSGRPTESHQKRVAFHRTPLPHFPRISPTVAGQIQHDHTQPARRPSAARHHRLRRICRRVTKSRNHALEPDPADQTAPPLTLRRCPV